MSNKVRVNLTLKESMVEDIDHFCQEMNVPRATLCQILVKRGIDDLVAERKADRYYRSMEP